MGWGVYRLFNESLFLSLKHLQLLLKMFLIWIIWISNSSLGCSQRSCSLPHVSCMTFSLSSPSISFCSLCVCLWIYVLVSVFPTLLTQWRYGMLHIRHSNWSTMYTLKLSGCLLIRLFFKHFIVHFPARASYETLYESLCSSLEKDSWPQLRWWGLTAQWKREEWDYVCVSVLVIIAIFPLTHRLWFFQNGLVIWQNRKGSRERVKTQEKKTTHIIKGTCYFIITPVPFLFSCSVS